MGWFTTLSGYLTPAFLILSPLLSYSDQAYSMYRTRSSAGFSLDIPLIMLVASLLRIFYYPGAKYDNALLVQSFVMVAMQVVLLKIALDHRPAPYSKGGDAAVPFARANESQRPFNFWQWRSPKPYWQFLLSLFAGLLVCEFLLAPIPLVYQSYSSLLGYVGLSVEATLPIPQLLANARSRSCKGFRLSVLASWLVGDAMKMFWFFTSTTSIPWAFKICGMFQAACDALLGVQYLLYGDGETVTKAHQSPIYELQPNGFATASGHGGHSPGRRTSTTEKST
ncbi:a64cd76c-7e97-4496-9363-a155b4d04773 [Thermothielavioides terrestris]|uniref:A64cd76c-7e97-4496-9363-a155b4d04773 n=1 Tax=Thermothielavioides terrestris TaxID=2587410 RepID=A0A3S4C5D9_9PEZI|nr:a64cd76c-7e97-4496-9363-a155b4d04773 [Thermothielavioides terrestris]